MGLRAVFVEAVRQLCTAHRVLLIADEVMTNMRCGVKSIRPDNER